MFSSSETDIVSQSPDYGGVKSQQETRRKSSSSKKIPLCWFFTRNGKCRFETDCRFRHSVPPKKQNHPLSSSSNNDIKRSNGHRGESGSSGQVKLSLDEVTCESSVSSSKVDDGLDKTSNANREAVSSKSGDSVNVKESLRKPKRKCIFFSRYRYCKFKENCAFLHTDYSKNKSKDEGHTREVVAADNASYKSNITSDAGNKVQNEDSKVKPPAAVPVPCIVKVEDLSDDLFEKLRLTEINQLKQRFRGNRIKESDGSFLVKVFATDPDWVFEVKSVWLNIVIPEAYPKDMLKIKVNECENSALPQLLIKHMNRNVEEWLAERHTSNEKNATVELVFRPFLRWFDKTLEDLFVEGLKMVKREMEAKAAGFEFVPFTSLQTAAVAEHREAKDETKHENPESYVLMSKLPVEETYQPDTKDIKSICLELSGLATETKDKSFILVDDEKQRKGTSIKAIGFLLGENIATVACSKISIVIQCGRCRSKCDFVGLPRKEQRISCMKCNQIMQATFRPTLLHQFSAVLGYLDLIGCKAFDVILLKCEFTATCLNCNNSTLVSGMSHGQMNTLSWCYSCHNKINMQFETFKFNILEEAVALNEIDGKLIQKKKELKDPAIQDGKPLPNNGTCKHYKKSYRWMRFPCCGKCYPCDFCHNDKEFDHEMIFAARMICGYCAKEQAFSNKPCVRCQADLTKKSTGHWDNGKGCRNKVKMSKDDKQKYSGRNKTVSRKVHDKSTKNA